MGPGTLWHFFVVEGYLWDWLTAGAAILVNLLVPGHAVEPLRRHYSVESQRPSRPTARLAVLTLNDPSEADDARMSYPSGHAAYMFFSMTIVSLYILGKLELLHRPSQETLPRPITS
ncbi:hypothetical protein TSOC_010723 [Tetrabaena socialis]|uniref:Phosphatidic acid phosphatase type 2/haloperoxidase domain-containing protein n=2 Tax=Tetrabaena socialis TaxID=47790 RepID=A0A2J7ZSH0_9CHLO|nr:hypothetical protein TSOC_010723 [Tetrabaena socialis]|eukprot:PNH03216.1 hypothetical protein TSOC_010723 [Tetrabaena socialis]